MPELCRFDGIRIFIYPGDHDPPHFHAWRADYRLKVDINELAVTSGRMPSRYERRLLVWAREHRDELMVAWEQIREGQVPDRIAPPRR